MATPRYDVLKRDCGRLLWIEAVDDDFGGTFGGPVEIPHVYGGTNRTFFFFSNEGLRLLQPQAAFVKKRNKSCSPSLFTTCSPFATIRLDSYDVFVIAAFRLRLVKVCATLDRLVSQRGQAPGIRRRRVRRKSRPGELPLYDLQGRFPRWRSGARFAQLRE
jgi:hypothetical protein